MGVHVLTKVLKGYASQALWSPCKTAINKISVNLFSKAKIAVANAFGGGIANLAPAYA